MLKIDRRLTFLVASREHTHTQKEFRSVVDVFLISSLLAEDANIGDGVFVLSQISRRALFLKHKTLKQNGDYQTLNGKAKRTEGIESRKTQVCCAFPT